MARIYSSAPAWTGTIGSGGVSDGSTTTIPLSSATGLTDGNYYVMSIDRVDASGTKTPSKWEVVAGQLSGTNLINCTRGVEGTAQAHSAGATVEVLFTSYHWEQLKSYLETEHNADGTHNTSYVVTPTATQTLTNKTLTSPTINTPTITIANNTALQGKDSGGTARDIAKIDTSNNLTIGSSSLNGINIYPRSSCLIRKTSTQSILTSTYTKIQFETETFDYNSEYDNSTNYRFTAKTGGVYLVGCRIMFQDISTNPVTLSIYKNGAATFTSVNNSLGNYNSIYISGLINLSASDYIEFFVKQDSGVTRTLHSDANVCYAYIIKIL